MFKKDKNSNNDRKLYIVAGGSRLGANVASLLSRHNKDVLVIDLNPSAFKKLHPDYSGYSIAGDAADISALEGAGIEHSLVVIAATDDDNTNIMVSQIAKKVFNVPIVIARLYSTELEDIASENGVQVVYPYKLSIESIEKFLNERGCLK
jgi:trk system potassium uptake protein TrkA